ncbi:DUF3606 domain-containing protein [Methylobacterium sp. WL2]|nr:DUF3606 domain-containing protein [Methylobacterium sp. WL1]TXN51249.1 DUF3606 domain-containing protein [Methylobacterium sp. WL2]
MDTAQLQSSVPTHIDINDRAARAALASRLGVTEERLRKTVRTCERSRLITKPKGSEP